MAGVTLHRPRQPLKRRTLILQLMSDVMTLVEPRHA
jgi:hypothetical protein